MSSYGGGASVTAVSAYNSNPARLQKMLSGNVVMKSDATGATSLDATAASFWDFIAKDGGAWVTLPANITVATNVIDITDGGGYFCGFVSPVLAVGTSAGEVEIHVDGVVHVLSAILSNNKRFCLTAQRAQVAGDEGNSFGLNTATVSGEIDSVACRLVPPNLPISNGLAVRFENSLKVTVKCSAALSLTGNNARCGVIVRRDSIYE